MGFPGNVFGILNKIGFKGWDLSEFQEFLERLERLQGEGKELGMGKIPEDELWWFFGKVVREGGRTFQGRRFGVKKFGKEFWE